jgi:hypothetical protein
MHGMARAQQLARGQQVARDQQAANTTPDVGIRQRAGGAACDAGVSPGR